MFSLSFVLRKLSLLHTFKYFLNDSSCCATSIKVAEGGNQTRSENSAAQTTLRWSTALKQSNPTSHTVEKHCAVHCKDEWVVVQILLNYNSHISHPELVGIMLKLQLRSSALQNNSSFLRWVPKPTHFKRIKRKGWISFPVFNNVECYLFFLYRQ